MAEHINNEIENVEFDEVMVDTKTGPIKRVKNFVGKVPTKAKYAASVAFGVLATAAGVAIVGAKLNKSDNTVDGWESEGMTIEEAVEIDPTIVSD